MRQRRNEGTKVWHNPEIAGPTRRGANGAHTQSSASDQRDQKRHRDALEALFAPRKESEANASAAPSGTRSSKDAKPAGRIVLAPPPQSDPDAVNRQRLLAKFLAAEGRPSVSKTANEFLKAGFTFPDEQDVHLKLLEHVDESMVCCAIDALTTLLAGALPQRRAVLESRLRCIEEYAEDDATRKKAEELRRRVSGRPSASA
jgi:hypothetical protein